jgi:DNA-binding beta-propeller fold protein YncE
MRPHVRSNLARIHDPLDDLHAIQVPADPNGLVYDRNRDTLYVADGGGAVLGITQGRRRRLATIPDAGCTANQLGGIAAGSDGTVYVARLGHGHAGAIFQIAHGAVTELPGLSPRAWRLGVAYDAAEHALYATRYHKVAAVPCDGSVERIDLSTGDVTPAIEGLCKPVGVVRLGSTLLVSDARRRAVFRAELVSGRAERCTELATGIDRPDSIAACDRDAVVLTTYQPDTGIGSLRKLWLDGSMATIARGCWEPRGIASDGDRAFVAIRRGGRVLVFRI